MRVLHNDEIRSTSLEAMYDRRKLKGQCTDVKSGCGPSVGPSLNPHSLNKNKILVTLSL